MKVKIGNKVTSCSREIIASHMANLVTTRLIILGKEKNFKQTFEKSKELCILFLKSNKNFVYSFGEDDWFVKLMNFKKKQNELFLQELYFKFSDGTEWTIYLNDLANIRMMIDSSQKDKSLLLKNPIELADWAQMNLSWQQVKDYCVLRRAVANESKYSNEWLSVKKRIYQYQYNENED